MFVATTIAGCGSIKNDDQVDGPTPLPVKLTALSISGDGLPEPTSIAVFLGPDGAVIKDGRVSDEGAAEAMMPAGGTVHVIKVTETSPVARTVHIQTFTGVKAGDVLTSGLRQRPGFLGGATTQMSGTFSSAGTGYTYSFYNDCGGIIGVEDPGGPGPIGTVPVRTFRDSCHDATIRMLALAISTTAGVTPRFVYTSFTHNSGGVFNVPNTWQAMPTFTLAMSNVPDEISSLMVTRYSYLTETGPLQAPRSISVAGDPPAGENSITMPYPAGVGTRAAVQTFLGKASAVVAQELSVRTSNVAAAVTLDASTLPLPWITALPTVAGTTVSWRQEGGGTPDLRLVRWSGSFTASGFDTSVNWYLADGGGESPLVTLPRLPAAYATYDPSQNTSAPSSAQVSLIDRSDLSGYDAARPNMFEHLSWTSSGLDYDQAFTLRRTVASSERAAR